WDSLRQSDEWRLLFFVRLAIELLTVGSQAADGAGFQLFASRSERQILSLWRSAPRTCWTSKSLPASVRCWIYWRNAHEPRRTEYHLLQGSADRTRARVRARERPQARRHVRRRARPHRRDPRRQDR